MDYTKEQVFNIIVEAKLAAKKAANKYFEEKLKGEDQFACGFAWVDIHGIRANSKIGKALAEAGIEKDLYKMAFSIWNPSDITVQNIDTKYEGALAFANVLESYGFRAYADSRLD